MKKLLFSLFFILCALFIFSAVKVSATDTGVVTITDGASVRTESPSGLRFEATVSGEFEGSSISYGFVLTRGTFTKDQVLALAENKKVEVDCGEPDGEGKYNVTITNIPEEGYTGPVTALAYVKVDGVNRYSSAAVTRNIADVARAEYNANNDPAALVTTIAEATRVKVTHGDSSVNYYGTLAAAITATFAAGDTVELVKGTYSDNITVSVNNLTIKGVNSGVHYDGARNANESILTGNISIAASKTGFTLDGLKFSGTSKITNSKGAASSHNNDGFTFKNNIVETNLASGEGFIYFQENSTSGYSYNLSFSNNHFKCVNGSSTLAALVRIDNNVGLIVENNKFEDAPEKAFYVNDATKGLAGNLTVEGNIFTNIGSNAFDVNWFSPYPDKSTDKELLITNNTFNSVDGIAIRFNKANAADLFTAFNISDNSFTTIGTGLYCERYYSTYGIGFNNNVFNTRPSTAYAAVNTLNGSKLNAKYNLFKENGIVVLPNAGKYESSKIDIFAPTSADPEDLLIKLSSTRQLNASNLGLDMTGTIEFASCSSDDESVATISGTGLITAVDAGETDIHATIVSYNNIPVTIHVEVVDGIVGASAVMVGGTSTYSYAGLGTIEWATSNDSIATIDEDGELTAVSYGEVEVILTVNSAEIDRVDVLVTPNEFYVDDDWSTYSNGDIITYNTKKYVKGLNAFHTIASSLAANRTINVLAGTYNDDFTISNDGVTINGVDTGITLVHTDSYSGGSHTVIGGLITTAANNITIQGIEIKNGIKLTGEKHDISISECIITASGKNEVIYNTKTSDITTLVVNKVYVASSNNRIVYAYGPITNLTVQNSVVLDSATGVVDFVRAGSDAESTMRGTVNFLNNYVDCTQSGFHERNAGADTYNFTNNYFNDMPNAIYSKNTSTKTGIVYNIRYNTFNNCLKSDKGWDVIEIDPSAEKTVNINYNAFANTGTRANCYAISVLGTATVDVTNNYFKAAADKVVNNVSPTDWELESAETTVNTYDDYKIVQMNDKYYVYKVNLTTPAS